MSQVVRVVSEEIQIDADYVTALLEDAGRALLALPGGNVSPRMSAVGLDVVQSAMEAYGWTEIALRPAVPSAAAISQMDATLRWLQFIPQNRYVLRRIVGARMLVHPITDKYLFTWRRIAKVLNSDHRCMQRWHAEGIDIIVGRLQNNY